MTDAERVLDEGAKDFAAKVSALVSRDEMVRKCRLVGLIYVEDKAFGNGGPGVIEPEAIACVCKAGIGILLFLRDRTEPIPIGTSFDDFMAQWFSVRARCSTA